MPDPLKLEVPSDTGKNVELSKFYTFNETGNIMLATTVGESAEIQESVRKVFAEVSVFFAAMTRAIATTPNPNNGNKPYSVYNYEMLRRIIAGSGCFIQVTEMDLKHTTTSFGATFSKELIKGLLGLATGTGALGFAQAMIAAMGNECVRVGVDKNENDGRVGNIVFVCEYLLGMPSISAIVVYIDAKDKSNTISVGPCLKTESVQTQFVMHKDTYMFVTPTFIHEYAGDLNSIGSDAAYGALVSRMRDLLAGKKETPSQEGDHRQPPPETKK